MTIKIGEVIAVKGVTVTIRMFEESNKDSFFFSGNKYKGVSIREHLLIQRGFIDIVCIVEGEFLDEKRVEEDGDKRFFTRHIEVKPIGYFKGQDFFEGIKYLPMIKDSASLISEDMIGAIYNRAGDNQFNYGIMLKEELPVYLPWQRLFNTHIGIFGNTGSGKSNTLTKIYTTLLSSRKELMKGKSEFVLLDFNGEYTKDQLIESNHKTVIELNTRDQVDEDKKFPLIDKEFWDVETISILFQATTNTQRPFLRRLIDGRTKFSTEEDSLLKYTKSIFRNVLSSAAPKRDCLDLLRSVAKTVGNDALVAKLKRMQWRSDSDKFWDGTNFYQADGAAYASQIEADVNGITVQVDAFDELLLRANIQLCYELLFGYVQYDHIQPLLKRMESYLPSLKKVLAVVGTRPASKILTVISLRRCNQDTKKVIPLLIAKHYYNHHKDSVQNPPDKTFHLIIDEAHNILSEESSRETEIWKDYRLELFEEIIKEGRKFGMFLTISSQRPADISPTIVSQVHNFFIHRLVNERDLFLINNTINTLDKLSKELIPTLPRGACVVTGTSFPLPMVVQVDRLERIKQPDSEDVDLDALWAKEINAGL
jgi:hypothetical protein